MIVSTTIDGIAVSLVLIQPDWTNPVELELEIPVDAVEGDTRRETRRPESLHPRFKQTFTPDWTAQDSEALITLRATLGAQRVAVPVWPDCRSSITDDFLFTGAHYVSWDDDGNWVLDADTYYYVAPLLIGRLDNNSYSAIAPTLGKTSLSFREDAPYSQRLQINTVSIDTTFTLDPNWTSVSEKLDSPLEFDRIGQARELSVENQESAFRYTLDAGFTLLDRDEISYLLSFWYAQKGRLNSFTVPAWFQPANEATEEMPNAYLARFQGEKLKLSFGSNRIATTELSFVQLPWELNDETDNVPVQAPRAYAFDFAFAVPGKANIRYIDWEDDVTMSGNVYKAYGMTVSSLTMGTRLFKEEATVEYHHDSYNPLIEFVVGGLERLVTLTIYEGDPTTPSTFTPLFVGKLKELEGNGRRLKAKFSAFGGVFDKKLPGFLIQPKCNYCLGDACCKIDLSTLVCTGDVTGITLSESNYKLTLDGITGTTTNYNDPDGNPGDRFAAGYLEFGSGDNYQIRFIRKSTDEGSGAYSFILNRPIDATKLAAASGTISISPGCSGFKWECSAYWSNYANFGGHPFVPDQLDTVTGSTPSPGK